MAQINVQLRDGVNGEMLTTDDDPAVLADDKMVDELLVEVQRSQYGLPGGNVTGPTTAKIINRTRGRELAPTNTLADVGTQPNDLLELFYTTVYGAPTCD